MAGPSSVGSGTVGSGTIPRIPMALQQIFQASQRGEDVEKISAPKGNVGFRIFERAGWGRRQKKAKPMKAPTKSSLSSDRSAPSRETAADASRKAMQQNGKAEVSIFLCGTRNTTFPTDNFH
jgi:hypothetical protein